MRLLTFDLRLQLKQSFGIVESLPSVEAFYADTLRFYEKDVNLRNGNLASLETVKFLVLQKNSEIIPFFKYIANKFTSQGTYSKRTHHGRGTTQKNQ